MCNCDVFSVVNVHLDHLKLCVVYIYGQRYVCCSDYNAVSDECDGPISSLVHSVGAHGGETMYFSSVFFRGDPGFLNCDDTCMLVVNKQFEIMLYLSVLRSREFSNEIVSNLMQANNYF